MSFDGSRVGTTFGKYKITGVLGKGGMGEVYEAYDNQIGRTVALKIIQSQYANDRKFRTRFERESHAAATLQEPHVIPIHGFGEIDGFLFIDMRLVRGQDLESLIKKRPLDPERAVDIIGQIAAALDAAHADGLIHRDVKPQNILVTPADFAYLVDFGLAETLGESTRLTATDTRIGSWAYMAPERFADNRITPSVDIYALACVLYESLTGSLPFPNGSQEALIRAHLQLPPPRPSLVDPRIPPAFDDVIARGMAKEPDDRYGSAGALARAAGRALRGTGRAPTDPQAYNAPQAYMPTERQSWSPAPSAPAAPPTRPAPTRPAPPRRTPMPPTPMPSMAPPPAAQQAMSTNERSGDRGSRGMVYAAIAVAAAAVLGAVGLVVGLSINKDSNSGPTAAPLRPTGIPPASPPEETSSNLPSSAPYPQPTSRPAAAQPPLVTGPDQSTSHETCDNGFQLNNATGFGTRGGRGSPQTSCAFANNVLVSYWNTYHNASNTPRMVSAPGAVGCSTVPGAICDPNNRSQFLVQCVGSDSNSWITCTGGKDAVVYLW
ncbi:hypothetical protein BST27_12920 [Mycobacterium intermedium]|uniref:non-specific serine/threonine protein kinase n=1 Tax=Mycobacterium intermedium TaxID=28445 RepID=A0A1T3VVI0_MYCIE|nr:serine/threonine-protein kinase [Mycobacterium intermedium]OPE46168.1 hypothetical protein BV508_26990 [Mycobacterium intermedium]ORB05533.1 hypothetical protein BST27_12920 [Mycobacterium intermedium]